MLEADFQSYIEKLEHNVDQYVENAKKGQTNNDQGNNLLEMYEKAFEACNLRYTEIQKNLVAFYKLYKTFHSKNQQHISSAQEVISGYGILGKALVLLDVFKKLDGTLNDETIKKIEPLKNKIDLLRREMRTELPEFNELFDKHDRILFAKSSGEANISDTQSVASDDEEFFDAEDYYALEEKAKDAIDSVSIGKDQNGDTQNVTPESTGNEHSKLVDNLKKITQKYINVNVASVSVEKRTNKDSKEEYNHANIHLKNGSHNVEIKSEFLTELYENHTISSALIYYSNGKEGVLCSVKENTNGKKVKYYEVINGSYEIQFNWYVNKEKRSITLGIDSHGNIQILEALAGLQGLEENKDVRITVGDNDLSLAEAVQKALNQQGPQSPETAVKSQFSQINQQSVVNPSMQSHNNV